jgi:hypothetical protein
MVVVATIGEARLPPVGASGVRLCKRGNGVVACNGRNTIGSRDMGDKRSSSPSQCVAVSRPRSNRSGHVLSLLGKAMPARAKTGWRCPLSVSRICQRRWECGGTRVREVWLSWVAGCRVICGRTRAAGWWTCRR